MIGVKLTESDGAVWTIVAADYGQYVISPDDFGPVETVTLAVLSSPRFGFDATAPAQGAEQDGWAVLADAAHDAALGRYSPAEPAPTPEQVFAAAARPDDG